MSEIISTNAPGNGQAVPAGYIVPQHGYGRLKLIQKGEVRNPRGHSGRLREVQSMCREKAPKAVIKLGELMSDPDPRVALMAAAKILEWGYGTPPKYDPRDETPRTTIDLRAATQEQLQVLGELLASGAIRPAPLSPDGAA